jgi:hypothetical protein
MSTEGKEYSFEQKERLARRIQKLRKPKYFRDIENIITAHNPDLDITTNPSGKFMYFQNLKTETYIALEKYVNKILKLKTISETSDSISTTMTPEITKYSDDNEEADLMLKYSNKERNLIKRKLYDASMHDKEAVSQNNVFVKRKT